jgi:hypothetical protein
MGRRALPIQLGHALLLQRIGSAFAEPAIQGEPGWGDCVMAAWVLSRPWPRAAARINARSTRWWLALNGRLWNRYRRVVLGQLRLLHLAAWHLPEFEVQSANAGSAGGADHLHTLLIHRKSVMHESDAEALAVPLARARIDYVVHAEQRGGVRLTGRENDLFEAAAAENAAWDRELRAGRQN